MKNINSDMYCTQCGLKGLPIQRPSNKLREEGHLKKLWCYHCKKENNFVEVNDASKYTKNIFDLEFKHHNFTKEGERKEPYKLFLERLDID